MIDYNKSCIRVTKMKFEFAQEPIFSFLFLYRTIFYIYLLLFGVDFSLIRKTLVLIMVCGNGIVTR